MLANTSPFMHADQDQPRNKLGKNMKEVVFMNEITRFNV